MKQPEIKFNTHSLRFPYAHVIFGKVFEMPCDVLFEYSESEGQYRIKVTSLVGTADDGTVFDLKYLTDDDDSMYSEFIVSCILGNKSRWDFDSGEKEWWE